MFRPYFAIGLIVLSAYASPLFAFPATPSEGLVITVRANKYEFAMGDEESVQITARFINRSRDPIVIVKPFGNSMAGWVGHIWNAKRNDRELFDLDLSLDTEDGIRFRRADFITIHPGRSVDLPRRPLSELFWFFEHGEHEVHLNYHFESDGIEQKPDCMTPEAKAIFEKMKSINVKSAPIRIHHEVPERLRAIRSKITRLDQQWWQANREYDPIRPLVFGAKTDDFAGGPIVEQPKVDDGLLKRMRAIKQQLTADRHEEERLHDSLFPIAPREAATRRLP